MRRQPPLFAAGLASALACCPAWGAPGGRAPFPDPRNPPPWMAVHPSARAAFDLGHAVFNTTWVPAGQAGAARRDGLGPLFVVDRCDGCHDNGGRGRPPLRPTEPSHSFVMQLGGPLTDYGHVLGTRALDGHAPEGRIEVTQVSRTGRYPDGSPWTLNAPRYSVAETAYGPLPRTTVLKPRIAPALFGAGLLDGVTLGALEAVRDAQPRQLRGQLAGRFGWQGQAITLPDQTALAFAREMGLSSDVRRQDDCTPAQRACREAAQGGTPEVGTELFDAVVTFQMLLAVPARPAGLDPAADAAGAALFERVGCAACHVPRLPLPAGAAAAEIEPYSDLLLHDLGAGLADRDLAGRSVRSRWRTPPLWGLAHALRDGDVALLHDGRARSVEEAILWHEGEARGARRAFVELDAAGRRQLLDWLATL